MPIDEEKFAKAAAEHNAKLLDVFARLLRAEEACASEEKQTGEAIAFLSEQLRLCEQTVADAYKELEELMASAGEEEVVLPGEVTDFKIAWREGSYSVKVADPEAVPDEYVKSSVTRKSVLAKIGKHLDALTSAGKPLPNWAKKEKGPRSLVWKPIKKEG